MVIYSEKPTTTTIIEQLELELGVQFVICSVNAPPNQQTRWPNTSASSVTQPASRVE